MNPKINIQEVLRLYTVDHITAGKIATMLKRAYPTIRNILINNGITIKGSHSHRRFDTIYINLKELNQLYTIEHLSSTEIAKRYGVTNPTILRRLRENDIPIRPKHGNPYNKCRIQNDELPAIITKIARNGVKTTGEITCPVCNKTRRLHLNRERIKEITERNGRCNLCAMKARAIPIDVDKVKKLYQIDNLKPKEIGARFNVSGRRIREFMKENHIPTRRRGLLHTKVIMNKGTLEFPSIGDICRGYDIGLNDKSYYIWVACPKCNQNRWQTKGHTKKSPFCRECSMKRAGAKHQGDKAVQWLGGISFEPYGYEFNNTLREQIRIRDNYTCQLCGTPQNGKKLSVHHIDYCKKNNYLSNLISLCPNKPNSCHSKTGHNRDYWMKYFTTILNEQLYGEAIC